MTPLPRRLRTNARRAGTEMAPHQERVVEEKRELDAKIEKLEAFLLDPKFHDLDSCDQGLLFHQARAMKTYSHILADRIERF